CQQYSDGNSF
nr:immunoglobulin light chain junction region [Macaca mulatta]MOX52320.1 immunoglobulin light chain junction region [Macaca mulatta]MOX52513.1 immunoglobulin light chain junction region [Macaca mulatta]MOX52942.1 immunoglobulin light chain junction region [Macaca mulatta]MOX53228.1 immunoglobulin light chain junction region [Macaca mulatta]